MAVDRRREGAGIEANDGVTRRTLVQGADHAGEVHAVTGIALGPRRAAFVQSAQLPRPGVPVRRCDGRTLD